MRLIVRACDYDWGKKDDNIGEVVIDAKELAMYGDAKTYNLTRNGEPEEGTVTLVGSFVPTSALTPGKNSTRSYVDQVQSSETLVLKVLRANGLRKADWFGNNDGKKCHALKVISRIVLFSFYFLTLSMHSLRTGLESSRRFAIASTTW